jgi:hypothetical protein
LRAESGRAKEDGERNGEACSLCCAGEPYEEGSTFSFGVRRRGGVSPAPPPYFSGGGGGVVGWRPCREKSDLMAGPRVGERERSEEREKRWGGERRGSERERGGRGFEIFRTAWRSRRMWIGDWGWDLTSGAVFVCLRVGHGCVGDQSTRAGQAKHRASTMYSLTLKLLY